jgi:hypothetical protein
LPTNVKSIGFGGAIVMSRFIEVSDRFECPYRVKKETYGIGIVIGACKHPRSLSNYCRESDSDPFPHNCPLNQFTKVPILRFDDSSDFYDLLKKQNIHIAYAIHNYEAPENVIGVSENMECAIGTYPISSTERTAAFLLIKNRKWRKNQE